MLLLHQHASALPYLVHRRICLLPSPLVLFGDKYLGQFEAPSRSPHGGQYLGAADCSVVLLAKSIRENIIIE